jgi:hypothetical protein
VGFLQRPANLFLQSHCRSVFLLRSHEVTTDGGGGMISHFPNRKTRCCESLMTMSALLIGPNTEPRGCYQIG